MTNNKNIVGGFAKGLRVLECFNSDQMRLSITDVSGLTGLDRATARRSLLTLYELGYAAYDGKFFSLTPKSLRLGLGALAAMPLPQIVQPWLDQLSEQIGQSCSVSILDGAEIVYLARAAQRRVMSIGLMPGSRLPAHSTSMGRILLASLSERDSKDIIENSDLTPRTKNSLTDPDDILKACLDAKTLGHAVIDQEIEIGLRSLAVPLFDTHDKVVAALNTGMAAGQEPLDEFVETYLPPLLSVQAGLRRVIR